MVIIKQLNTQESFSYHECQANIDEDAFLSNMLDLLMMATWDKTGEVIMSAIGLVKQMLQSSKLIRNEKRYRNLDENSGTSYISKQVTKTLHQQNSLSLKDPNAHFLESFSIEFDKQKAFGTVQLQASTIGLLPVMEVVASNPNNIDLSIDACY